MSVHDPRTIRVTTMWEKVHEIRVPEGMTAEDATYHLECGYEPEWLKEQITSAGAVLKDWATGGDEVSAVPAASELDDRDLVLLIEVIDKLWALFALGESIGAEGPSAAARQTINGVRGKLRRMLA